MIYELLLAASFVLVGALAWGQYSRAVLLVAGLMPTYLLQFSVAALPTNFFEAAVVLIVVLGLSQAGIRQQLMESARTLPRALGVWLAAWLVMAVVSVMISAEPRVSLGILKGWIVVPLLLGMQVYSVVVTTPRAARSVILVLTVSGVCMAGLAVPSLVTGERAQSFYDVPNSLALYLAPLCVLAWWQGWRLAGILLVGGLLATQSVAGAGAVVSTLLGGAWWWADRQRRTRLLVLSVTVMVVAVGYFSLTGRLDYFIATYRAGMPNSVTVRQQLWSISGELLRDHPLLGIGLGQFEPAYQQKLHERFTRLHECEAGVLRSLGEGGCGAQPLREFVFRDPHNWLLSFWLNTGIVGLISFIGIHVVSIRRALRMARAPLVQALLLALLAIVMHGFVDTVYWKNDLAALHWVLLALLTAAPLITSPADQVIAAQPPQ